MLEMATVDVVVNCYARLLNVGLDALQIVYCRTSSTSSAMTCYFKSGP